MRSWLSALLLWGIYPAWLLAGAGDYLCHRKMDIERTSGAVESWLHLVQFGCLAVAFACAMLLEISAAVFVRMQRCGWLQTWKLISPKIASCTCVTSPVTRGARDDPCSHAGCSRPSTSQHVGNTSR